MTDAELLLATEAISGVGGWAFDPATHALQWTPQAFRLHGLAPGSQEPAFADALARLLPADQPRFHALIQGVLAHGQPMQAELQVQLPGGASRRLLCQAFSGKAAGLAWPVHGTLRPLQDVAPERLPLGPHAYEMAIAAAGVGVFEGDVDRGHHVWSARMLELHGLPPGAAPPNRAEWRERFLYPPDRERVDARASEFTAGGRAYEMDYRIRRADDGSVRWLHTRASFVQGEGRRHVLGITMDITERKQAEERALDAWHALDLSATQVGFGFGYRNVRGPAEWSPQLKAMFGLAPDAAVPSRDEVLAMIDPADREHARESLSERRVIGEMRELEYTTHAADGQRRVLMSRSVLHADAAGQPWRHYFVVIDVTQTRAHDRRIAGMLEHLQMATEASGIGTWERDPQADRAHWDVTTRALFGLPPDTPAPSGEQILALVHPEDRAGMAASLLGKDDAPGASSTFEFEFRVPLPDGRVRWLLSRGRTHHDEQGRVLRRSGICFDVTERRVGQTALQAKAMAERANEAKTEFLSRMSHELRTPLNAVLGFAQLLMLDAAQPLAEAQRGRVAHIQAAGWHLLALINDVLDLTRIESRQAQITPALVPLADVVDECLAMNAAAAAERGITLRRLPDGPEGTERPEGQPRPQVWADRTRVKQVLLNLLSNAIKYNREAGWVEVQALPAPAGTAEASLVVRDSGLGFTPAQLAQLFQPFNRLGREQGSVEGTGIGLTLSKLIAEQMGGRLEVSSEPGQGSEFRFTLPTSP